MIGSTKYSTVIGIGQLVKLPAFTRAALKALQDVPYTQQGTGFQIGDTIFESALEALYFHRFGKIDLDKDGNLDYIISRLFNIPVVHMVFSAEERYWDAKVFLSVDPKLVIVGSYTGPADEFKGSLPVNIKPAQRKQLQQLVRRMAKLKVTGKVAFHAYHLFGG